MEILILFIVCTIFAILSYIIKAFNLSGTIVAWILSLIIAYTGGITAIIILAATYIMLLFVSKLALDKKRELTKNLYLKKGNRDAMQVIANIGVATLSLVIYHFTNRDMFFLIYAAIMATALADSMASEIGILSNRGNIDICTFKPIQRGLSGGITFIGTVSGLLGSIIIGLCFFLSTPYEINTLFFITLTGFLGMIIDSIYGSLLQVKYKCKKCGDFTEKKEHCKKKTIYYEGVKWINNDIVNLFSTTTMFLICMYILAQVII